MSNITIWEGTVQRWNSNRGRSRGDGQLTGCPACFKYDFDENRKFAKLTFLNNFKNEKATFRRAEPWGFAFVHELEEGAKSKIKGIQFAIGTMGGKAQVEAFVRRVSFLAMTNPDLTFQILEGPDSACIKPLYHRDELYNRPENEIIIDDFKDRTDRDMPGRLEKDFQSFLFGKGLNTAFDERTNERLAIFGEDFFNLSRIKKTFKLLREFPTGVFKNQRSPDSRVLPTEFVDIVTLNKYGQLALIELKLDNPELQVISQLLGYALFFRCYFKPLAKLLHSRLNTNVKLPFVAYIANNHFHPRFPQILKYYHPDEEQDGFLLKQIVLGHTSEFRSTGDTPM